MCYELCGRKRRKNLIGFQQKYYFFFSESFPRIMVAIHVVYRRILYSIYYRFLADSLISKQSLFQTLITF